MRRLATPPSAPSILTLTTLYANDKTSIGSPLSHCLQITHHHGNNNGYTFSPK